MNKEIDLAVITGGKMLGTIAVSAWGWNSHYSWGHSAEVWVNGRCMANAKLRYYNRTWECYRFQSVVHSALYNYVKGITGIDPFKGLANRDKTPMKSAAAESRRLGRVAAQDFAKTLYSRLTAWVDGALVLPNTGTAETHKTEVA